RTTFVVSAAARHTNVTSMCSLSSLSGSIRGVPCSVVSRQKPSRAALFPATSSCCKAVRRGLVSDPSMAIERLSPGGEQVVDGVRESPQQFRIAAINDGERHVLLLPPVAHQTFCDKFSPNTPLVGSLTPLLYRIS